MCYNKSSSWGSCDRTPGCAAELGGCQVANNWCGAVANCVGAISNCGCNNRCGSAVANCVGAISNCGCNNRCGSALSNCVGAISSCGGNSRCGSAVSNCPISTCANSCGAELLNTCQSNINPFTGCHIDCQNGYGNCKSCNSSCR